jgi:hypothetical protein
VTRAVRAGPAQQGEVVQQQVVRRPPTHAHARIHTRTHTHEHMDTNTHMQHTDAVRPVCLSPREEEEGGQRREARRKSHAGMRDGDYSAPALLPALRTLAMTTPPQKLLPAENGTRRMRAFSPPATLRQARLHHAVRSRQGIDWEETACRAPDVIPSPPPFLGIAAIDPRGTLLGNSPP